MKYSKDFRWFIGFDTVGSLAGQGNNKCDKVWKKGMHLFRNGNDLIFRIVYRITDKTYYWQVGVPCKRKNSEQDANKGKPNDTNQQEKRTFKNLLDNFKPLTKEEQKDLLLVILTRMDYYKDRKSNEAMDKMDAYSSVAEMLMTGKENPSLEWAHHERLEWKKSRKEFES